MRLTTNLALMIVATFAGDAMSSQHLRFVTQDREVYRRLPAAYYRATHPAELARRSRQRRRARQTHRHKRNR